MTSRPRARTIPPATVDHIAAAIDAALTVEEARATMARARRARQAAVTAARETMTAAEIADALQISRARVYAIAAGKE